MSPPITLPIDELLDQISANLKQHPTLVLEAPPGAGKTTRVPARLMTELSGTVLVTQPRRLAARLAAVRVAEELGEPVGQRVGYRVRFEDKSSKATRLLFVTEGILSSQLAQDSNLTGVSVVVMDEFHERHVDTDSCLALLRAAQQRRPDLRLVIMSATLNARAVALALGCPHLTSSGRQYPVQISYAEDNDDRPLEKRVVSTVKSALKSDPTGNVLVFLPGVGEIHRSAEALTPLAKSLGLEVLPLHGDLNLQEQSRAVRETEHSRVVLATNVAESSVTVAGITAVVDSGLARVAKHSSYSGRASLTLEEVSQASCDQRAGRAGRTRAGQVMRLYSKGNFERRRAQDVPELLRSDLTDLLLRLLAMGHAPEALQWLEAPPLPALESAWRLLRQLGAAPQQEGPSPSALLTRLGRQMARFPLHPRLARLILAGAERGPLKESVLAAALLSERDIRLRLEQVDAEADSDLDLLAQLFEEAEWSHFSASALRAGGLSAPRVQAVKSARQQLSKIAQDVSAPRARPSQDTQQSGSLQRCLLDAFPDRVARRKREGSRELTLRDGAPGELAPTSAVHKAPLLLALDAEERGGGRAGVIVRLASAISEEALYDQLSEQIEMTDKLVFNAERGRVECVSRVRLGSIVLEESVSPAASSTEASEVLLRAAKQKLAALFAKTESLHAVTARIATVQAAMPEAQLGGLTFEPDALLRRACEGATTLAEVSDVDVSHLLMADLSQEQQALIRECAPESLTLPGGRRLVIHYERDQSPWIGSRLQDFFGMSATPRICRGRVPLAVHLLAPNQRAVQVTTDLGGFWATHYPALRKQLSRRYPKHSWPEDGLTAKPPAPLPPKTRR